MGPILNTIIGAGIKLGCNLINSWLEQKRQDQMILAARDNEMLQAMIDNQAKQASDPFVKITRRVLFMSITFTMCYREFIKIRSTIEIISTTLISPSLFISK